MKEKRQTQIIELIHNNKIGTQDELTQHLQQMGYIVTQATISRDIRELKLVKTSAGNRLCYTALPSVDTEVNDRFLDIFIAGVTCIDSAQNLIIIKTLPGMAMGVAACLDTLNNMKMLGAGLIGTVSGDDCIIGAVKSEEKAVSLVGQLKKVLFNQNNPQCEGGSK